MKPIPVSVTEEGIVEGKRPPREGDHLSDILQYYRWKTDRDARKALSEMDYHRFKIGEGFECGVLSRGVLIDWQEAHTELWRSYKMERDKILMEIDAAHLVAQPPRALECKYTHFGLGRDIMDSVFRLYHWQLMSYVHNLEHALREPVWGRFIFCYGNGNYTSLRQPVFKAWDMPWEKPEKVKNWDRIRGLRDQMKKDKSYKRR